MNSLHIVNPGMMTVQDLGRPNWAAYGVPQGGAMDSFALQAANLLVGNPPTAAALEITGGGAEIEFLHAAAMAVAGADFEPKLNGQPVPLWQSMTVRPGARLTFGARRWGARSYLAILGGIDVPVILDSRSTFLPSRFGGFEGRMLQMGDTVPVGANHLDLEYAAGRRWPWDTASFAPSFYSANATAPATVPARSLATTPVIVRVLAGPHAALLGANAADVLQRLIAQPYRVALTSNRMGYRLEAISNEPVARPILQHHISLPSLGVVPGAIQVPPDGAPIALMMDAQTTGGYPIVANIVKVDLSVVAQLLPGDTMQITLAQEAEAIAAFRYMCEALQPATLAPPLDEEGIWMAAYAR